MLKIKTTLTFGCLTALGSLFAAGVGQADDRASAIAKANQELASEVARFNIGYTFAIGIDWRTAEADKEPSRWASRCASFMHKSLRPMCTSTETGSAVPACVAQVNAEIKTLRCVVTPDENLRVERKGSTLLYYMPSVAYDTSLHDKLPPALDTLLPKVGAIVLQHDGDAYFAKRAKEDNQPTLTVDAKSFLDGGLGRMRAIATFCSPAWDFLEMVNNPECQLKTCKGDFAKKQKFLEGARQLRCVHSKEPRAPEKSGDAIVFYSGEWAQKESDSLTGIPFAAFNQLRSKLKLRDCGADDRQMDPSGSGGIMTSYARRQCCPKDAKGKCMKVSFDKYEEVCRRVGFTTEKKCYQRDRLEKKVIDKAR